MVASYPRLATFCSGFVATSATLPVALSAAPPTAFAAPVTPPISLPAEPDISPACTDCQPALSARMPVSRPVAFLATSKRPYISTSFAITFSIEFSKSTSLELVTIGSKMSSNRMAMTVPNTLNAWTMNAVIHCFVLPPPSSGCVAKIGGAMMYRNSMLNMRAMQLRMMVTRSKINAMPARNTTR